MKTHLCLILVLTLLSRVSCLASLTFMDITPDATWLPGIGTASWTGSLNGVGLTGTLTAGGNVAVNAVAPGIGFSTIVNDSPQWSYPGIYTPTSALDDRIGWSHTPGGAGLFTVTFAVPMSNLVFHIANLDLSFLDFSPSIGGGLTGLTLVSGNGGAGDGLAVGGPTIFDMAPGTADGTPPTSAPPVAGPRSAYGSVRLDGTYTTISFLTVNTGGIENANFTFSIPEPGISALAAMGGLGILLRRRRSLA